MNLASLQVVSLLCRHRYVQDFLHGGFAPQPLVSFTDLDTRRRVYTNNSVELLKNRQAQEELARDSTCAALYADLAAVLRGTCSSGNKGEQPSCCCRASTSCVT